jgi:hypothetical protein
LIERAFKKTLHFRLLDMPEEFDKYAEEPVNTKFFLKRIRVG